MAVTAPLPLGVATTSIFSILLLFVCVSMPRVFRLSPVDGWTGGIFNVCKDLSVCCAHEGKTGAESCTSFDWEEQRNCPSSCLNLDSDPTVAADTGSPAQRTNCWATALFILLCNSLEWLECSFACVPNSEEYMPFQSCFWVHTTLFFISSLWT